MFSDFGVQVRAARREMMILPTFPVAHPCFHCLRGKLLHPVEATARDNCSDE